MSHELNTPFVSHLLYVSVSVSIPSSASSTVYRALVDSGVTINLVHKFVVSFLELTMQPPPGLLATLADSKTVLSCSGYVSLSYTIAGVSYHGTFFVAPLGAQSMILGMRYLEWENPVIDLATKTPTPRSGLPPPTIPTTIPPTIPTPIAPSPILPPTPPPTPPSIPSNAMPPSIPSIPSDSMPPSTPLNLPSSNSSPHRIVKTHADAKPCTNAKSRTNAKPHTNAEPPESPESQSTSESPPTSQPKCSRKRLPSIFPTRHINPKRDQLLLFTIVDVTGFKEAIAAAINLDPDLDLNLNP